jgi:putative tricarboxylic transport membrane protein
MSERVLSLPAGRRIAGLVGLIFSVPYVYYAWTELGFGRWRSPGAAIFPIAVGVIVALASISVLLERAGKSEEMHGATYTLPQGESLRKLVFVLGSFAIYFVAMEYAGHQAASAIFLIVAMSLIAEELTVKIAIYGVVIALAFQLLFVRFLQVQMPKGLIS